MSSPEPWHSTATHFRMSQFTRGSTQHGLCLMIPRGRAAIRRTAIQPRSKSKEIIFSLGGERTANGYSFLPGRLSATETIQMVATTYVLLGRPRQLIRLTLCSVLPWEAGYSCLIA